MRLLIYGGSFNPPHRGHVYALRQAAEVLSPDRILVIPAGIPPHKILADGSPDPDTRLELCRLAFSAVPGAEVSDLELRREGKSYTVDTLREIRGREPEAEIFFQVGTDMLLSMENWFEFREIFSLCDLAALPRNEGDLPVLREVIARFQRQYGETVRLIPRLPLPMDSTSLRALLPERGGRDRLDEKVYAYIIRRRLYGAKPELAWLREQVKPFLKPKRYLHTLGCEQEAAALARRWGAAEDDASEAALLHDITKRLSAEEQLRLCGEYGILLDDVEKETPELLHARTGAYLARERFGVPEEIFQAISSHTTGRPGMSLLEKIIWLADTIEPTRDYPGVEKLRSLAMEDLDLALIEALRRSLELIKSRGHVCHPRTAATLDWLLDNKNGTNRKDEENADFL